MRMLRNSARTPAQLNFLLSRMASGVPMMHPAVSHGLTIRIPLFHSFRQAVERRMC
jgi:hypothetical protein